MKSKYVNIWHSQFKCLADAGVSGPSFPSALSALVLGASPVALGTHSLGFLAIFSLSSTFPFSSLYI